MDTEIQVLNHEGIVKLVTEFLVNKPAGNWHKERIRKADLHAHGADLVLVGGKRNSEYFIIECKGKSSASSANSINKEGWLNALGQLVTRMDTERIIQCGANKGKVNRAYKYGLGLYWVGAQTALRRIPHKIANTLNLYIFSVYDDGWVVQWSPKNFGKEHPESSFHHR